MPDVLLDGWADALGHILAEARREWSRERDIAIAEIRAEAASRMLALSDRIEERMAALPVPRDGRDADMDEIRRTLGEMIAALPPPPAGEPGVPGRLPLVRDWSEGVHYEASVVAHNGATWQARQDTAQEPPHEDWALLAAPGAPGRDAYAGEVHGAWRPDGRYQKHDLVARDGGEWRARRDDPGPLPGDGWALSAVQGSRGQKGERGDRGEAGRPGADIAEWLVEGYRVVPVMTDGRTGPPLDLRPLFELFDGER